MPEFPNYYGQVNPETLIPNGIGIEFNELGNIKEGEFINGSCNDSTNRFTYHDGTSIR